MNDDVMETDVKETENEVTLTPASQHQDAQGWTQLLETGIHAFQHGAVAAPWPGEEEGG